MRLCIIGEMQAGKDTIAEIISRLYGNDNVRILKFGKQLVEAEKAVYDEFGLVVPEDKTKRRKFLQYLGTEFLENLGQYDLLAKLFEHQYAGVLDYYRAESPYHNFLITDARRDNQIEVAKKYDFKIIRVNRMERDRINSGATNTDHASENLARDYPADKLDYEIFNYGTLDELENKVKKMIDDLYPEKDR